MKHSLKSLEHRYSSMLNQAQLFLKSKEKNKNGSAILKNRILHIQDKRGQCPQCGVILEGGNYNTEHIHDLSLGGDNSLDNRVLICKMCNDYRNKMAQGVLGPPRYCNGFPGNWETIKKYLIWGAITIDEGFDAGKSIPSIHNKFLEYATGGIAFTNKPTRYFGRCSQWDVGEELISQPIIKKPGLLGMFFDKVFGFESKTAPIEVKVKPTARKPNDQLKQGIAEPVKPKKKQLPIKEIQISNPEVVIKKEKPTKVILDSESGESVLEFLNVLTREITLAALGHDFKAHLVRIGKEEMTMKQFAIKCGNPKSRSLVKIFEEELNEYVHIRKEGTRTFLSPIKYPTWQELNNSSKGIKLPREPKTMSEIYLLLIPLINSGSSQEELLIEFGNLNSITQSRRKRILSQIKRALFQKNVDSAFWHFPNLSCEELNQKLEFSIKEGNGWNIPDRGDGFNWAVTEYFRNVRIHLDNEEE